MHRSSGRPIRVHAVPEDVGVDERVESIPIVRFERVRGRRGEHRCERRRRGRRRAAGAGPAARSGAATGGARRGRGHPVLARGRTRERFAICDLALRVDGHRCTPLSPPASTP